MCACMYVCAYVSVWVCMYVCVCVYVCMYVRGLSQSKCTNFLFRCLLDSTEITRYLLQNMTLAKLHSSSNVFVTDHSSTGSHFL